MQFRKKGLHDENIFNQIKKALPNGRAFHIVFMSRPEISLHKTKRYERTN
jgi:hypothetical protein